MTRLTNPVDKPVIEAVGKRYSPYLFAEKEVSLSDLHRCLEAARWAPSSFNDQPWSWIVARQEDAEAFAKLVGVLAEPNRAWAGSAGVLMIAVVRETFRYNGQPNRVALHDLGAASALMSLQAAELGLQVHQMAGLDQDQADRVYQIPDGHRAQTALAIGHPLVTEPSQEQQAARARELDARSRLALDEQVFGSVWGTTATWLSKTES